MTCIVVLHGRGESIPHGMAHGFADRLRNVLQVYNMTDYDVIEVGLSTGSEEDYNWSSFKPLSFQLEKLMKFMRNQSVLERLEQNCTRIHLVGCSQGALLLRGLLKSTFLDPVVPKIDKLITFGGPNNGIFGIPGCDALKVDNFLIKIGCRMLESTLNTTGPTVLDSFMFRFNSFLSISSYWNSPADNRSGNTFLADINNENSAQPSKYLSDKTKGLVLISFENEEMVLPNISTTFGFWDRSGKTLIPYNQTNIYENDLFGLKTLDQKNSIQVTTIPNASHMDIPLEFIRNEFINFIK